MLCAVEIGLLVFGIIALATGKMQLSKNKVVEGMPARMIGIIAILPLPLVLGLGVLYGVAMAAKGQDPNRIGFNDPNYWIITALEAAIALGTLALVFILGMVLGGPPKKKKLRREEEYEDEYYDDDAPPMQRY